MGGDGVLIDGMLSGVFLRTTVFGVGIRVGGECGRRGYIARCSGNGAVMRCIDG